MRLIRRLFPIKKSGTKDKEIILKREELEIAISEATKQHEELKV